MIDLPTVCNAPRALVLDGVTYRARTLTVAQLGEVLAWLDDRLPADGSRDGPPPLSGESSRLALATAEGLAVVLHLALAACQPGLTRDGARALAAGMDEGEADRLMAVAFRRRPGFAPPAEGRGKDLAEIDWGLTWEALARHRADRYEMVGGLTLDQFDCWSGNGETDDEGTLSPAQVQAMWEAAQTTEDGAAPDLGAILRPGERIATAGPGPAEVTTDG